MIIDIHVHLSEKYKNDDWMSRQWPGTEPRELTAEQFIEKMDSSQPKIDKAVIFGLRSLTSESPEAMRKDNDYILKAVESYPDRYIGAGAIDLSWGARAIEELHRTVNSGLRVVKLRFTSYRFRANCKAAKRALGEIEGLGVLVLIHSDWSPFSQAFIIGDLARNFPNTKIVMQHFGMNLNYEAMGILRDMDNLYADTSACLYTKCISRFSEEVSPERIMYGSDTISIRGGLQPQDGLNSIKCLETSSDHKSKILGENAAKLLRSVGVKL